MTKEDHEYCKMCKGELKLTTFMNGDTICRSCEKEYFQQYFLEYCDSYVENRKEDYYLNWWFGGLPLNLQLEIVLQGYDRFKANSSDELQKDRLRFCHDDDDFHEYIKERLQ